MPIARDLSSLPRPKRQHGEGLQPDATPRFAHLLAEEWAAEDRAKGDLARAHTDARFRHSDAAKCARAVAYAALDVPASNPMDLSGTFVVRIGSWVHEQWQRVLQARYPGAEVETQVHSGERAGHIDAVVRIPEGGEWVEWPDTDGSPGGGGAFTDKVVAIEAKTVGGYAYKMAVGERGRAQGPKNDHIVQAALNAYEVDADEAVIVYWGKDAISIQAAARNRIDELTRFCAEWTLTREDYRPIAEQERKRIDGILALIDGGELPARIIPDPELPVGHRITNPTTGGWEQRENGAVTDLGSWWACHYCRWQDMCATTPAERTPIETVVSLDGAA